MKSHVCVRQVFFAIGSDFVEEPKVAFAFIRVSTRYLQLGIRYQNPDQNADTELRFENFGLGY